MIRWRIVRGFAFGSVMEFAAASERVSSNFGSSGSLCQQLWKGSPNAKTVNFWTFESSVSNMIS